MPLELFLQYAGEQQDDSPLLVRQTSFGSVKAALLRETAVALPIADNLLAYLSPSSGAEGGSGLVTGDPTAAATAVRMQIDLLLSMSEFDVFSGDSCGLHLAASATAPSR